MASALAWGSRAMRLPWTREARLRRTRNTWTELRATLASKHFWALVGWSSLVLGLAGLLLWLAAANWDSALRATPMVCRRWGNTDWSILAMALVAPFFVVSLLGAISEFWHNLERRRKRITRHWRPFMVFSLAGAALGVLILALLNC